MTNFIDSQEDVFKSNLRISNFGMIGEPDENSSSPDRRFGSTILVKGESAQAAELMGGSLTHNKINSVMLYIVFRNLLGIEIK